MDVSGRLAATSVREKSYIIHEFANHNLCPLSSVMKTINATFTELTSKTLESGKKLPEALCSTSERFPQMVNRYTKCNFLIF